MKIIPVLIPLLLIQCGNPVGPAESYNLILNPDFSINGKPSTDNWNLTNPTLTKFVSDFPPFNIVKWSLALKTVEGKYTNFIALGKASQNVKLLKGNHIYRFSFWGKNDSLNPGGAEILVSSGDSLKYYKDVTITSPYWKRYCIIDTLSSDQFSSIEVRLLGGPTLGDTGNTLFALCRLTAN